MTRSAQPLLEALAELDPAGAQWIEAQLVACSDLRRVRVAFARAARKLAGPRSLELGRTALVLEALDHAGEAGGPALIEALLRTGEIGEQHSLLQMLSRLPGPERFTALAIEACRTNVRSVLAAIANDNPFPAAHFPDPAFNQMVLKVLFVGLPAAAIERLAERATPELRRMAEGYASERRAAGRSVPSHLDVVLAACRPPTEPYDHARGDQP